MPVGSKWQLFIPAELAYGDMSRPKIPAGSTLIFEIELLSFSHPAPPAPPQPLTSDIIKVPSAEELKKGAKEIKAGSLGSFEIVEDNILLGKPFIFNKGNIDKFDF